MTTIKGSELGDGGTGRECLSEEEIRGIITVEVVEVIRERDV